MWVKPEYQVVETCAEATGYFFRREDDTSE